MNHVAYARAFKRHGVRITINTRLKKVGRDGNKLLATLGSDYDTGVEERRVGPGRGRARHGTAWTISTSR